ncbi:MAG: hypothetical protein ABI282_06595 [Candidatus Baltobacteraceae bacterium]
MITFRLNDFIAASAFVALAGCAGGAPGTSSSVFSAADSVVSASANVSSKVYVANVGANAIYIYRADVLHGKLIGKVTQGVNWPTGVYIDSRNTLYVASWYSFFTEYPNARGTPSETVQLPSNVFVGNDLIAAGPDGTVYVTAAIPHKDTGLGERFEILEYDPGASAPAREIDLPYSSAKGPSLPSGMTFDRVGDLLVDEGTYCPSGCRNDVYRYAPKATVPTDHLGLGLCSGGEIAFVDGNELVVADPQCSKIYVQTLPLPGTRRIIHVAAGVGVSLSLDRALQTLYATAPGKGEVYEYNFRTGSPSGAVLTGFQPQDIAIDPPAF